MQCSRNFFGRQKVVAHRHRKREVDHQHRRRPRDLFGLVNFKVIWRQTKRQPATLSSQRVAQRLLEVQVERVAILVRLGLVGALMSSANSLNPVLAESVAFELAEQVAQGLFADTAQSTGGQLKSAFFLINQSGFAQRFGEPR